MQNQSKEKIHGDVRMNRSEARFQEKLQRYKGKKRIEKRFRFRITKASNTGKTKRYSHQNFEAR
mgnify:CR=1 FL=1